jgi:hypothetical protein
MKSERGRAESAKGLGTAHAEDGEQWSCRERRLPGAKREWLCSRQEASQVSSCGMGIVAQCGQCANQQLGQQKDEIHPRFGEGKKVDARRIPSAASRRVGANERIHHSGGDRSRRGHDRLAPERGALALLEDEIHRDERDAIEVILARPLVRKPESLRNFKILLQ